MIALSWSRISDYRQCPRKFYLKYLEKAPNFQLKDEDKSPQLVRGGNIHKGLERYVIERLNGKSPVLTTPEIIATAPLIDRIMENYSVHPERQIAIDSNFKEVSWYAKDAWFRVIYDLIGFGNDLLLGDYKTGKFSDYSGSMNELGQLHLSALVGFSLWPEYEDCSTLYIYVDHKKTIPCQFKRNDSFKIMQDKLVAEHAVINSDIDFLEKKNPYCKWCEGTAEQCINKRK